MYNVRLDSRATQDRGKPLCIDISLGRPAKKSIQHTRYISSLTIQLGIRRGSLSKDAKVERLAIRPLGPARALPIRPMVTGYLTWHGVRDIG